MAYELVDEKNLTTLALNISEVNREQNDAGRLDMREINLEAMVHVHLQISRLAITERS